MTASIAVGPLLSGSSEVPGRGATDRDVDETVSVDVGVCALVSEDSELNVGRVNVTLLVVVEVGDSLGV